MFVSKKYLIWLKCRRAQLLQSWWRRIVRKKSVFQSCLNLSNLWWKVGNNPCERFIKKIPDLVEYSSRTAATKPFFTNHREKVHFSKSLVFAKFMVKSWKQCMGMFLSKKYLIWLKRRRIQLLQSRWTRIPRKMSIFQSRLNSSNFWWKVGYNPYECLYQKNTWFGGNVVALSRYKAAQEES